MNQGVNLLCREGNSQPGHWMLIPERPRERGKKMLLNPERKKSRSQIASNKIWKGSQFPLFLLSFYHFLLSLTNTPDKERRDRDTAWDPRWERKREKRTGTLSTFLFHISTHQSSVKSFVEMSPMRCRGEIDEPFVPAVRHWLWISHSFLFFSHSLWDFYRINPQW